MAKFEKAGWVIKVNDELKQIGDGSSEKYWKKLSIYRLPAGWVTDQNKEAYTPQAVSFGPYHRHQEHLQPMEEHKRRALLKFLKRSNKPLEDYIKSLAPVVQDLKDSYESLDPVFQQDTDKFLQLMILDGCFMLEILRKSKSIDDSHKPPKSSTSVSISFISDGDDYESDDPVFSNHGKLYIMPYIKRDMLMIENQLPMMVLYNLRAVQNDKGKPEVEKLINELILKFYYGTNAPDSSMGKCLHVLDLCRKSLLLFKDKPLPETDSNQGNNEIIRSAMELHEAGIQFKKSETGNYLDDISFQHGVLSLPHVSVGDATKSMFLNLIAFERFHVGAGNEVTSYIFLMDSIIDNAKDVTHLKKQGIIQNAIGSDKAVAELFNSLSKDITLEPDSRLHIVHKNVNKYCEQRWNEWRAYLIHTYFKSPWAFVSLIAAIFLFALTITQTIYTVFPYYKSG